MKQRIFKAVLVSLSVCVLSLLSVRAQAPGYMGKKLVMGYGIYANPAFSNLVNSYSNNILNVQHEGFVEHATRKNISLGFSVKMYKYTYNNVVPVNTTGDPWIYGLGDVRPFGSYDIKARNFLAYAKFFKRKYVAPWGKYFILGLTLNRYKSTYDPEKMFIAGNSSNFGPTTQNYTRFDLFFGKGNCRILANRIVLDYGYTINVIAMSSVISYFVKTFGLLDEDTTMHTREEYIKKTTASRMDAVNRFNLYLKIGYLF